MKEFQNMKLIDLCILGTHDSGAYKVTKSVNAIEPSGMPIICNPIIKKWSITQKLDITSQLNLGVRYFDLRIRKYTNEDKFQEYKQQGDQPIYIVHSLLGLPLNHIFRQIHQFLNNHPTEVVLIDINHDYYDSADSAYNFNANDIELVKQMIKTEFDTHLSTQIDLPIGAITQFGRLGKAIVFYRNGEKDKILPSNCICSKWPNKDNFTSVQRYILNNCMTYTDGQNWYSKLTVQQLIKTPGLKQIFTRWSLKTYEDSDKNNFFRFFRENTAIFNIFIIDFINETRGNEYLNLVILENRRRKK